MNFNWADDTNCAVTVCDTEGVVIYQNKQSISVNGEYRGKSMLPCHNDSRRNAALRTGIIERPGPEASEPLNDTRNFNRKAAKKYTKQPLSDTGEESNDRLSSKTLRRGGSKRFTALSTAVFRKQERPRLIAGAPVYLLTTEISRIREDTWSVRTRRSYNQRSHAGRTDLSA